MRLPPWRMNIPYFEVAAFARRAFSGNPAGVCLLENDWLPNEIMQSIAAENNLAETAFLIPRGDRFSLRWMTPEVEVDLCGHATLASAHVLMHHRGHAAGSVRFESKSGDLLVKKDGDRLVLDFPARPSASCAAPAKLAQALRAQPVAVLKERDYIAVFEREADVAAIQPDFSMVASLDAQGVVVTAPGEDCDFVSRYFVPAAGIPEDPVTGSTHCTLIPYWSRRLGRKTLRARQISRRGGELFCEDKGERVLIGGYAATYMQGTIEI
jgi:PhzF family phenazine biosynthesis protein